MCPVVRATVGVARMSWSHPRTDVTSVVRNQLSNDVFVRTILRVPARSFVVSSARELYPFQIRLTFVDTRRRNPDILKGTYTMSEPALAFCSVRAGSPKETTSEDARAGATWRVDETRFHPLQHPRSQLKGVKIMNNRKSRRVRI